MKEFPTIEVSSLEDSLEKIEDIIYTFRTKGVLRLRGFSFSPSEQLELMSRIGNVFGWHLNTKSIDTPPSEEQVETHVFIGGHSDDPNRGQTDSSSYLLDWHIEQVFYVDPFLAAAWNMFHVGYSDKNAGNTYFVDSSYLYDTLSDDYKEFLQDAILTWDKPIGPNSGFGPFYTRALDKGPVNGRTTLRIETDGGCLISPSLCKKEKRDPTDEEIKKFNRILFHLKSELKNNEDIRYVQQWEEGDVVLVDLFRMYHAVSGGFNFGERKFHGIFTRPVDYTNNLYDSLEKLWTEN